MVRKVIELERQKGFTDRAVVGGIEALVRRHFPEAAATVTGYSKMSKEERAEALKRLEEKVGKILHKNEKLRLNTPIRYAPGVGEKREALFTGSESSRSRIFLPFSPNAWRTAPNSVP